MKLELVVIGFLGMVIGGGFTFLGVWITARTEIRKLHLSFQKEKDISYIENARKKVDELYIPLYIKLTAIEDSYSQLRDFLAIRGDNVGDIGEASILAFKDAFNEYKKFFDALQSNGSTAFLIYDLEEKCRLLSNFIGSSLSESKVKTQHEVLVTIASLPSAVRFEIPSSKSGRYISVSEKIKNKMLKGNGDRSYSVSILPGWLRTSMQLKKEYLSAPIPSKEFEYQFSEYVFPIKAAIKEVALGAKA